jgi:hypothetical protein
MACALTVYFSFYARFYLYSRYRSYTDLNEVAAVAKQVSRYQVLVPVRTGIGNRMDATDGGKTVRRLPRLNLDLGPLLPAVCCCAFFVTFFYFFSVSVITMLVIITPVLFETRKHPTEQWIERKKSRE